MLNGSEPSSLTMEPIIGRRTLMKDNGSSEATGARIHIFYWPRSGRAGTNLG